MLLCKGYLLQVPITKLDIVNRGWDGISFTSVATASATQRYKDISLPLPLLQTSEIICSPNLLDAEISDIITHYSANSTII